MKKLVLALAVVLTPLGFAVACGGGEATGEGAATPTASASTTTAPTGTASTATTATTASATASTTTPPPALPPSYVAARDKWKDLIARATEILNAKPPVTSAVCDKVGADLVKLAKDAESKKIAQAYSAESAKLTADQQKTVSEDAMAKTLAAPPPVPMTGTDGGPLCPHNKKIVDGAAALGELFALAYAKPK